MMKRKFMRALGVGMLCMVLAAGIGGSVKVYAANSAGKTAKALGGTYRASTKTLTLRSNIKLKKDVTIKVSEPLTIDMNGKRITGGKLVIDNKKKAPVMIVGTGTVKDGTIVKYGKGKLTLAGNIVYKNTKDSVLKLYGGTTVIRDGKFYSDKTSAVFADYDEDAEYGSYLYIKGGIFHGDVSLANTETYIQKGILNGMVYVRSTKVYVKGGTLNKGLDIGEYADYSGSSVYISGGKILDQVLMDVWEGSNLEISGGTIQSGKSAVIQSNISETNQNGHSDIKITGGEIISTAENGYGIKAVNTEIAVAGGSIQNATGKGKTGIYSVRYNENRKNVQMQNADKVTITGFESDVENEYKENYCGENIRYSIDPEGTLTITGTGEMFSDPYQFFAIDNGKFKDQIKKVVVEEGVTTVGGFSNCDKIESVSLPSSVQEIDTSAFYWCTSLQQVTMQDGIKSIGNYAFFDCYSLKEFRMPDTVTQIGSQLFDGCTSLETAHLSTELKTLPDLIFNHCKSLKSIEIPDGVTTIPYGFCYGCKSLTSVKLPSKLEKIEAVAFISCTSLKEIKIPSTVKEIGRSAFKNCKKLKTVDMKLSKDAVISKTAFANTPYKG